MRDNDLLLLYGGGFNEGSRVCTSYVKDIVAQKTFDEQITFLLLNPVTCHGIHPWTLKHIIIKKEPTNCSRKRRTYSIQHCSLMKIWVTMQIKKYLLHISLIKCSSIFKKNETYFLKIIAGYSNSYTLCSWGRRGRSETISYDHSRGWKTFWRNVRVKSAQTEALRGRPLLFGTGDLWDWE